MANWTELVGTGEEIAQRLLEEPTRRFRVVAISDEEQAAEPSQSEDQARGTPTLAERFAGRVGRLSFDPPDLASKAEEYFGAAISQKYAELMKRP